MNKDLDSIMSLTNALANLTTDREILDLVSEIRRRVGELLAIEAHRKLSTGG